MKYSILVDHCYFRGGLNAPKNGQLQDARGYIVKFETKEEAEKYLKDYVGASEKHNGEWSQDGPYELSDGQYERPGYKIKSCE